MQYLSLLDEQVSIVFYFSWFDRLTFVRGIISMWTLDKKMHQISNPQSVYSNSHVRYYFGWPSDSFYPRLSHENPIIIPYEMKPGSDVQSTVSLTESLTR